MLDGALTYCGERGNASTGRSGRAPLTRAGRGIVHSEMNASGEETAHLLQIWIELDRLGLKPGYAELDFELETGTPQIKRRRSELT
jgi:redox-sensitive bicupin YhaK (pirin superfamily)